MEDRLIIVSCLYDLERFEGRARARSVADYLALAPAVLGLGFETVVFTEPNLTHALRSVAARCAEPGKVHVVSRELSTWPGLTHRRTVEGLFAAGRRSAVVANVEKDTAAYLGLNWSKPAMLREAHELNSSVDLLIWVDLGIAHVAVPPAHDVIRDRLVAGSSSKPRRIRCSAMDVPRPTDTADRARWYRERTLPCVAGGLIVVPAARVEKLATSMQAEVERCVASGWPATDEVVLGAVLADQPDAFEVTAGEHSGVFDQLGVAVPAVAVQDAAARLDAVAVVTADAERWAACRAVLGLQAVPGPLEAQARSMEFGAGTATLATLVPATRMGIIEVPVAPGWNNTNPTVAVDPLGGFRAVVRQVNYEMHGLAYHFPGGEAVVRTRNVLVGLSDDLGVDWSVEIDDTAAPLRRGHGQVLGFEDLRLFHHDGHWRALAVIAEAQPDARPRIAVMTLTDDARVADAMLLAGPDPDRVEKNWVPITGLTAAGGDPMVLYSHWPLDVRTIAMTGGSTATAVTAPAPVLTRYWRGGSQLVPFDDGYLAVVHETLSWGDRQRFYVHRFVVYNRAFVLQAATQPFTFAGHDVEFAAGLALTVDDAIVTFGIADRSAAVAVVPLDALRRVLLDAVPTSHLYP